MTFLKILLLAHLCPLCRGKRDISELFTGNLELPTSKLKLPDKGRWHSSAGISRILLGFQDENVQKKDADPLPFPHGLKVENVQNLKKGADVPLLESPPSPLGNHDAVQKPQPALNEPQALLNMLYVEGVNKSVTKSASAKQKTKTTLVADALKKKTKTIQCKACACCVCKNGWAAFTSTGKCEKHCVWKSPPPERLSRCGLEERIPLETMQKHPQFNKVDGGQYGHKWCAWMRANVTNELLAKLLAKRKRRGQTVSPDVTPKGYWTVDQCATLATTRSEDEHAKVARVTAKKKTKTMHDAPKKKATTIQCKTCACCVCKNGWAAFSASGNCEKSCVTLNRCGVKEKIPLEAMKKRLMFNEVDGQYGKKWCAWWRNKTNPDATPAIWTDGQCEADRQWKYMLSEH